MIDFSLLWFGAIEMTFVVKIRSIVFAKRYCCGCCCCEELGWGSSPSLSLFSAAASWGELLLLLLFYWSLTMSFPEILIMAEKAESTERIPIKFWSKSISKKHFTIVSGS